ncbi:aminotransferase class I/II-fold pyridoxal phosphate-dependent enzyme [Nitrospinota bacterium]
MLHDKTLRRIATLLRGTLHLDQSVSVPELGSLFVRHGDKPLQRLKCQIAEAYGVPWAFLSTNGTTVLNILALLTACPRGGRVLLNRDAHVSAMAAIIHGEIQPTYFVPSFDDRLGVFLGPTHQQVEAALASSPGVDCIFLTSPNYFGIVGQVSEIIVLAHERGCPVVVDAAHAPHFHFCKILPTGAEDLGADLITQSTHKVASALSQGSVMLVGDEKLIDPLYENINDLGFISTSFSYPILASIELGVGQLFEEGEEIWRDTVGLAEWFREQARHISGVRPFGHEAAGAAGFQDFDRTRVAIDVSETGITGFAFEDLLIEEGIYPEMATLTTVLFLLTPGTSLAHARMLLSAVERVASKGGRNGRLVAPRPPAVPALALIPREAKYAPKRVMPIRDAVGEPSGETIATYPPGAPVIVAGEVVTCEVLDFLNLMKGHGAVLKGASDPSFRTMKIVTS